MEVTVVTPFGAVPLMTHVITIFTAYITNTPEAATLGFNLHVNTPPAIRNEFPLPQNSP